MDSLETLDTLPVELLHEICSYLIGPLSGFPGSTGLHSDDVPLAPDPLHPFYALAGSCRVLRLAVESYCQRLLRTHRDIMKIKLPDIDRLPDAEPTPTTPERKRKAKAKSREVIYRVLWVKWARSHCAFCGKRSVRRAIFNTLIRCCAKCDAAFWPPKITMSEALKSFNLTKLDLFRPNPFPLSVVLPRITHATYDSSLRRDTTVFFKADIERLAELIHGSDKRGQRKRQTRRIRIMYLMEMEYIHGRSRCWRKNSFISSIEEHDVGESCTCETGGREASIAKQKQRSAFWPGTIAVEIDPRCAECQNQDKMERRSRRLLEMLCGDVRALPPEIDERIIETTLQMCAEYVGGFCHANDWGRKDFGSQDNARSTESATLWDASCVPMTARWRR